MAEGWTERRAYIAYIRSSYSVHAMTAGEVLKFATDAIWLTVSISAPVLIVGLVVGVGIGLLQALTQIQEQTLVYAPKILAIFLALLIFLPLMGTAMKHLMEEIAARIASM